MADKTLRYVILGEDRSAGKTLKNVGTDVLVVGPAEHSVPLLPGSKVSSSVPSLFRRTRPFRRLKSNDANCPPTRIFPSDCSATAYTTPSVPAPGVNEVSSDPSAFKRAIPPRL